MGENRNEDEKKRNEDEKRKRDKIKRWMMLFEKSRPSEGGDSSSSSSTTSFLAGPVNRQQVPSFRQMNDKEGVEVFLAAFEGI